MAKKQYYKLEKHIYVEERCGSFRFQVKVHPLNDSATVSTKAAGLSWARNRRIELLNERDGIAKASHPSEVGPQAVVTWESSGPIAALANINLSDVFDWFEQEELPKLAGKSTEASRLALLRKCFSERTIDQLDEAVLEKWKNDRLSGKYGSGRAPNRAVAMMGEDSEKTLTKHQRYYRKNAKVKKPRTTLPDKPLYPVSSQSVRHELVLFRRAVTKYLKSKKLWSKLGAWWEAQDLMQMELPKSAEPRSRRVSDEELVAVFSLIEDQVLKAAILFAVLTSLRRGEIVSLKWEDVDFKNKVVRLHEPGFVKSKTHQRDVPLLPGALKILQDLQPKKNGPIFPVLAADLSFAWRKAADAAKIYDARLHDCRREAISRLVESCRLTVHEVVLFSGHSDIRTLEKHYLCLNAGVMASRLAELPAAVNMAPSL